MFTVSIWNSILKYILQLIDDADLAELFPEQTPSAPAQQPNFSTFTVHNSAPDNDDKSIADNGERSPLCGFESKQCVYIKSLILSRPQHSR